MLRRKITKVMLPCIIEFQRAKSYLRSAGRPTKDHRMLLLKHTKIGSVLRKLVAKV